MSLKLKVKVGGINNLSDARYCAGMGVEFLGFNIDPESQEALSPELFDAITGWVSGVEIVGEVQSSLFPDTDTYNVTYVQLSDPGLIETALQKGVKVILSIDLDRLDTANVEYVLNNYKDRVAFYLFTRDDERALSSDETKWIGQLSDEYNIMIGAGTNSDQLETLMDMGIKAIAIYGSNEERPGFKTYDEMADILEALEV